MNRHLTAFSHCLLGLCNIAAQKRRQSFCTLLDFWHVGLLGRYLPMLSVFTAYAEDHEFDPVANYQASVFKVCRGVSDVAAAVVAANHPPEMELNGNSLYEFAEEMERLVCDTQVCAGSPSQSKRVLEDMAAALLIRSEVCSFSEAKLLWIMAQAGWEVERACFLYELMRSHLWWRFGTSGAHEDASPRHAFATCAIANHVGRGTLPLSAAECRPFLCLNADDKVVSGLIEKAIQWAREIQASPSTLEAQDYWNRFSSAVGEALSDASSALANAFPSKYWIQKVFPKDLNLVFGRAPFSKEGTSIT